MSPPQAVMLGSRLHLQHGPIDLMIEAWGDSDEVRAAYAQARAAFESVLQTLVDELPGLRKPNSPSPLRGPVAQRMFTAVSQHTAFITPMAAVAGSVADHILAAIQVGRRLSKVVVNNGGDIALWLSDAERMTVGVGNIHEKDATLYPVTLSAEDRIGGIATSGWRGRSHSLGIADFVTVFAKEAASADAAATLIANAVDLPSCAAVRRTPAEILSPDSDLGARLVTVDVGPLSAQEISKALTAGQRSANAMQQSGLISTVIIGLQGQHLVCGGQDFLPDTLNQADELPFIGEPA